MFDWAAARWFECLIPIYWLYERRPEDWLLDLAHALRVEGFDYEALYREWRLEKPQAKWTQLSHVVNLAMSLKAGGAVFPPVRGGPQRHGQTGLHTAPPGPRHGMRPLHRGRVSGGHQPHPGQRVPAR